MWGDIASACAFPSNHRRPDQNSFTMTGVAENVERGEVVTDRGVMAASRSTILSIALVCGAMLLCGFLLTRSFNTHTRNEANRQALLRIRDELSIGDSPDDVLRAYSRFRTDELSLVKGPNWCIEMPTEFGATDWNLIIEYRENGVSAVRVRTSDGPPPSDGPTDMVAFGD